MSEVPGSGAPSSGSPAVSPQLLNLQPITAAGGVLQPTTATADDGGSARATRQHMAQVRPRTAPLASSPELRQFIDAVIIPALLERLLREHPSPA